MSDFVDEISNPQREPTPTFSAVLRRAMKAEMAEMRVAMPAEVVTYEHKTQKASVRPYFKRKFNDGNLEDYPVIYNVPVAHPRAGKAIVHMPVKVGDTVLLVFVDRSLEKWLTSGKGGDPEDTRMHDISDAIAIPGGYAFSDSVDISNPDDIIIKNDPSEIRVKPNGHFQIMNQSNELLRVLDEYMTADISGNHPGKIFIQRKLRTLLEK